MRYPALSEKIDVGILITKELNYFSDGVMDICEKAHILTVWRF